MTWFNRLPVFSPAERRRHRRARAVLGLPKLQMHECSIDGCRSMTASSLCELHRASPDAAPVKKRKKRCADSTS